MGDAYLVAFLHHIGGGLKREKRDLDWQRSPHVSALPLVAFIVSSEAAGQHYIQAGYTTLHISKIMVSRLVGLTALRRTAAAPAMQPPVSTRMTNLNLGMMKRREMHASRIIRAEKEATKVS